MADEKEVKKAVKKAVYVNVVVMKVFTLNNKLVKVGEEVKLDADFIAKMTANGCVKKV